MGRRDRYGMGRVILPYGLLLAVGMLALQWLDTLWLARSQSDAVYLGLVAVAFLTLGIVVGRHGFARVAPRPFHAEGEAAAALGISAREMAVLGELAAGRSNKEIARVLAISPNTVKTHLARLFEKLDAARRTEAIGRARMLGLIP